MKTIQRVVGLFASVALTAPLFLTSGCSANAASDGDEGTATVSQPIIGGSAASAYPEAVLVDIYNGGQLYAYCSGSVIAPNVVMTAGHCVDGFTSWQITAPNAAGQTATSSSGATYDYHENGAETVNPNVHDIGLIFLDNPISLKSYPVLATTGLADGASITNIGRIDNGVLSTTNLYVSSSIPVENGADQGYPNDYACSEVIQSGDSGGPDEIPGSSPHMIVSVNSGAGGGSEVLARVDLLSSWISGEIASHGGAGSSTGSTGSGGSSGDAGSSGGGDTDAGSSSSGSCAGGGATYDTSTSLAASACGNLGAGADDWFTYSLAGAGDSYDVELTTSGDAQIELWKQVTGGYVVVANTTATSVQKTSTSGGAYYLVVWSPSGSAQSYSVTLSK